MRQTHTFVELQISPEAFEEIRLKLANADYLHLFDDDFGKGPLHLAMQGIALTSPEWEKDRGKYYQQSVNKMKTTNLKFIVTWRSTAPPGVNYQTHKFSLLDALETASQFLGTDYVSERECLLVGGEAYKIIKTLPHFVIKVPPPGGAMMQKSDEQFGISTDYSVGVAGELASRQVYWTNDPALLTSARLINSGKRIASKLPAPDPASFVAPGEKEQDELAMHGPKWIAINISKEDDSHPIVDVREAKAAA